MKSIHIPKRQAGALKIAEPKKRQPTRKERVQALGRLKTGELNETESAYDRLLKARQQAGEIAWYAFEGMKFRLADNTFYTPDFAVMLANGELECHEVKGFWTDDARVKIKVAAKLFPIRFLAVQKKSARGITSWITENFGE